MTTKIRLIDLAREVAVELATARGVVTSPEVLEELRRRGYGSVLDQVDTRFMGAVFRGPEWVQEAWEGQGSHSRPVAVWRLR